MPAPGRVQPPPNKTSDQGNDNKPQQPVPGIPYGSGGPNGGAGAATDVQGVVAGTEGGSGGGGKGDSNGKDNNQPDNNGNQQPTGAAGGNIPGGRPRLFSSAPPFAFSYGVMRLYHSRFRNREPIARS